VKTLAEVAFCLACAGCIFYSLLRNCGLAFGAESTENRQHLLRLDRYLRFGQAASSVERLTGERLQGDTIEVRTKSEFGARNWTMMLEFDKQQRLRAVRYRCPDGVTVHPKDAPPDREDKAPAF